MKKIAVVVPISCEDFTPEVKISLRHLRHYLGNYDTFFVIPDNICIRIKENNSRVKKFNKKYFLTHEMYNRFLLSQIFYRSFKDYEYILVYQLDSLVFSSDLDSWCLRGYDYIGAPWFTINDANTDEWQPPYNSVGNGGLSLRKIDSCLRVLSSRRLKETKIKRAISLTLTLLRDEVPGKIRNALTRKEPLSSCIGQIGYAKRAFFQQGNEDLFWAFEANKFYPGFIVAPVKDALSFSFEREPRNCFEKNNRTLPFGCHAWFVHDREFWRPYILPED